MSKSLTNRLLLAKWWKLIAILLMIYTFAAGLLMPVPRLDILNETIRNAYFHVPMWFGMMLILLFSLIYSIKYLSTGNLRYDYVAIEAAKVGVLYGLLGLTTGMIWAQYTWGAWWNGDPKQNMAAIAMLMYLAYIVLRGSISDQDQRAKVSAVYNIFAFVALFPLLYIVPRLTDSLHPSNGGNQGFVAYDMDGWMRLVFYPAIIGWTFLGLWIASLNVRATYLEEGLDIEAN